MLPADRRVSGGKPAHIPRRDPQHVGRLRNVDLQRLCRQIRNRRVRTSAAGSKPVEPGISSLLNRHERVSSFGQLCTHYRPNGHSTLETAQTLAEHRHKRRSSSATHLPS